MNAMKFIYFKRFSYFRFSTGFGVAAPHPVAVVTANSSFLPYLKLSAGFIVAAFHY
jgi:hypothetical protein